MTISLVTFLSGHKKVTLTGRAVNCNLNTLPTNRAVMLDILISASHELSAATRRKLHIVIFEEICYNVIIYYYGNVLKSKNWSVTL